MKKLLPILVSFLFLFGCQKEQKKTIILSKASSNYIKWIEDDNTIILDAYTIKNTDSILGLADGIGYSDEILKKKFEEISSLKYSFVHADFDLYKPTLEVIKFVIPRLEENAILLVDDYNLINQEGVKWAVRDAGINIDKGIQTQSGQLIFYT